MTIKQWVLEPKKTRSGYAYFKCHPCGLDVMVPGVSLMNIMQEGPKRRLGAAVEKHLENHKGE